MRQGHHHTGRVLALAGAALLVASTARAQEADVRKLHVHGYFSQAYARSSELPVFGIPTGESTLDYRSAALQLRYAASDHDEVVLQFTHRRLGESLVSTPENGVELDWAFYQRLIGPVSLRVGRVPMPIGIYNEMRDVGTLLPFYRAPGNVYLEGFETIDGVVLDYEHDLGDWRASASVIGGEAAVQMPYTAPEGPVLLEGRMNLMTGGQFWLHTPVPGVRLGTGVWRWRGAIALPGVVGEQTGMFWTASADADLDRFYVRGEYQRGTFGDMRAQMYYGQAGVELGRGFSLNAQGEVQDRAIDLPTATLEADFARDVALGINFAPTASLVLKLEGHRARGLFFDEYVDEGGPPGRSNYMIASISVSF